MGQAFLKIPRGLLPEPVVKWEICLNKRCLNMKQLLQIKHDPMVRSKCNSDRLHFMPETSRNPMLSDIGKRGLADEGSTSSLNHEGLIDFVAMTGPQQYVRAIFHNPLRPSGA